MTAYLDRRASPVGKMELSSSKSIPEFLPKLAEQAGLGKFISHNGLGTHLHENGEIYVERVTERDCT